MTTRRRTSTSTLLAGWLFADLLLGITIIMLGAQTPSPPRTHSAADTAQASPQAVRTTPDPKRIAGQEHPGPEEDQSSPTAQESPSARDESTAEKSPSVENSSVAEGNNPSATDSATPEDGSAVEESPVPARPRPSDVPSPTPSPCVSRLGEVQAKPITISFQVSPGAGDEMLTARVRQELLRHRDQLAGKHAGMVLTFGADGAAGNGVRLATRVNSAIREAYPRIFGAAVTRNFHDLSAPAGSISMEVYLMTYGCSVSKP